MKELVELLTEQGLPVPPPNLEPVVTVHYERTEAAA